MVYNSFYMLLDTVCYYFVEEFCAHIYKRYWPGVFLPCDVFAWFWYEGNTDLIR